MEMSGKAPAFTYSAVCRGPDGKVKWTEHVHNLVTTEGKNFIIDTVFKGSAYTAAWFLGLKGTGTAVIADTLASHSGWSEVTPYAGNRPTLTFGTTAAGSSTATAIVITATSSATVAGAFAASVNSGTSGTLYGAADFAAPRPVTTGDVLTITAIVAQT